MNWWWALLPAAMLVVGRLAVTAWIVPAWREDRLSETRAAGLVVLTRGLTLGSIVLAIVMLVGLAPVPGMLTALAAGVVYAVVGWRPIRAMFRNAER
jgi:hypothetical protein